MNSLLKDLLKNCEDGFELRLMPLRTQTATDLHACLQNKIDFMLNFNEFPGCTIVLLTIKHTDIEVNYL